MNKNWKTIGLVVCALSVTSMASHYEYAHDDGTGNWAVGPSQWDADMLYGNYFEVNDGNDVITSISVAYSGSVPENRDVTFYLFEDPDDDMDPTNAIPVAQHTDVTRQVGINEFLTFDIEDVQVSGGFFVGVNIFMNQHENSIRMDPESQSGQSWLFFSSAIDPDNLGGSPLFYNMGNTPFNGSWMIRAQAIPEPVFAFALFAGLAVIRRR